jgi:fatty acid-binding protein DegV
VFARLAGLTKDGYLFKEKAEDMRAQVAASSGPFRSIPTLADMVGKTGILFDSTADLPPDFFNQWKDCCVPLFSVVDACSYRDRLDIDARTLSNIVRLRAFETVGTSGCSFETCAEMLKNALAKHTTVLLITLPHKVSEATYNNIQRAIGTLSADDQKRLVHHNTKFTLVPGWKVMRAYWLAANKGMDAAGIDKNLHEFAAGGGVVNGGIIPELGYLRRSGRFDHLMGKLCGVVGKVLIKAELDGKAFSFWNEYSKLEPMKPGTLKAQVVNIGPIDQCKTKMLTLLKKVAKKFNGGKKFDMQISHQCEPWKIQWFLDAVKKEFGDQLRNVYVAEQSCLLLTASGRGVFLVHMWPADDVDFPFA